MNKTNKRNAQSKGQFRQKQNKQNKRKIVVNTTKEEKIPLQSNDIMPPSISRQLNYIDSVYTRNNSGANWIIFSYRINDLYDPDPAILTGSISGFKELMSFYNYYQVNHFRCNMKIFNNEAYAIIYGGVFSIQNLSLSLSSRDDAVNALESNYSTRARLLSAKGGLDHEDVVFALQPRQLLGNPKIYDGSPLYSGAGLSSPNVQLWLNIIVASPNATPLANGVTTSISMYYKAKFYARTNIRA